MITAIGLEDENPQFVKFFTALLRLMLGEAARAGLNSLEITPSSLSDRIRGIAKAKDRFLEMCQAMRDEFLRDAGDVIVEEGSIQQPTRLTIRYALPRPASGLEKDSLPTGLG